MVCILYTCIYSLCGLHVYICVCGICMICVCFLNFSATQTSYKVTLPSVQELQLEGQTVLGQIACVGGVGGAGRVRLEWRGQCP